jgi:hypothetical protein
MAATGTRVPVTKPGVQADSSVAFDFRASPALFTWPHDSTDMPGRRRAALHRFTDRSELGP